MFEVPEHSPLSYLKKLGSTDRFGQVPETIIDQIHPSPSALNINSIKILSWNIAKNNHFRQWSSDFLAIVEQYQPDKIFLQEVRLCAVERQIPELASMGWSFAPNLLDTLNNTYSGVLIATKADWINRKAQITRHHEPVTRTRKVSLFAEYSLGDRKTTLLAVNTHLINFVELSKFQAQLQGLEMIISQHQGAVIFSGDFNTWNRSRWLLLSEMTAKLGLTSVSFPAVEAKKIKRFMLSPPLDYIFFRELRQKQGSARVIDNISSSDHNPLLVEFYV